MCISICWLGHQQHLKLSSPCLQVEQLHKIFKLCGTPPDDYWKTSKLPLANMFKPQQLYESTLRERCKEFPKSAVSLIETFLSFEPHKRGTASSALDSKVILAEYWLKMSSLFDFIYSPSCRIFIDKSNFRNIICTFLSEIFLFFSTSIQNHMHVIHQACRSTLLTKRWTPNTVTQEGKMSVIFLSYKHLDLVSRASDRTDRFRQGVKYVALAEL